MKFTNNWYGLLSLLFLSIAASAQNLQIPSLGASAASFNEITCLPGEESKVIVTEADASVDFVVRGVSGGVENPSRSCWCGEGGEAEKRADQLFGALSSVGLAKKITSEATTIAAAKAQGKSELRLELIRYLDLAQDYEFTVELPPGVGLRSQTVACLSPADLDNFVDQVNVYLDANISQ